MGAKTGLLVYADGEVPGLLRQVGAADPARTSDMMRRLCPGGEFEPCEDLHAMHSVVDWLAFAVWEDGRLLRSLSLSPGSGIIENIGDPLAFERPYWAGEDEKPYPLPFHFHPLELGEEALRALCGFVLEGRTEPGDIDASAVVLHGFRVRAPQAPDAVQS